jgi:hypothetical protein
MFRRYLLPFLISITICFSLFAQNVKQTGGYARILGMGNNPYLVDPYFITVNPAWGSQYPNFLFGDLGGGNLNFGPGGNGQFVSANFHLGGGLTIGGILSRNDFQGVSISRLDPLGLVNILNSAAGSSSVIGLENNVELMGSIKSGNFAFGLGIALASTNNEFNPAQGDGFVGSATQLGFNAGILARLTPRIKLDGSVSLILPSASWDPVAPDGKLEASQTIILVNGRAFIDISSKLSFVPTLLFLTASGSVDNGLVDPSTSSDLQSYSAIVVGAGTNYSVGDFLLAGGVALSTFSVTTPGIEDVTPELTDSRFIFPIWNLGVEWNLTDWFIGRFGYFAATGSNTDEQDAPGGRISDVNELITTFHQPLGATVGVSFRLGNFSLDATVNEDVLRQGLNNIGGGGPTFAYLSLAYAIP